MRSTDQGEAGRTTEAVDVLLIEDQAHDAELALRALDQLELGKTVSVVRDGAAALLDMKRTTLLSRMDRLGVDPSAYRS